MGGFGPIPGLQEFVVSLVGVVPGVPFVKADVDIIPGSFLGLDVLDDAADSANVFIQFVVAGKIIEGVPRVCLLYTSPSPRDGP